MRDNDHNDTEDTSMTQTQTTAAPDPTEILLRPEGGYVDGSVIDTYYEFRHGDRVRRYSVGPNGHVRCDGEQVMAQPGAYLGATAKAPTDPAGFLGWLTDYLTRSGYAPRVVDRFPG